MVFYCFPRIIGRVHREGKAIHQSTAEKGEREREKGEGTERWCEREVLEGGVSMKMEGKIGEGRGKGVRKNRERGEGRRAREWSKMETEG